jgi:hypothetical protein
MEDKFVPSTSTQLRLILGDFHYDDLLNRGLEEVELTEKGRKMLWNGEWNWEALDVFLRFKIAWLGNGIVVDSEFLSAGARSMIEEADFKPLVNFGTYRGHHAGSGFLKIMASPETTRATQTAVCDLLLQYLAEYETTHIVILESTSYHSACPLSGPALSRFLTHSPAIKGAELQCFELNVEHCRALVTDEVMRREGFKIKLSYCSLTEAGEPVLFEGIRRNRGPTSLHGCRFNMRPFAEALRGNTRIKQFGSGSDVRITMESFFFCYRLWLKTLASKSWIFHIFPSTMKAGMSCASRLPITPQRSIFALIGTTNTADLPAVPW